MGILNYHSFFHNNIKYGGTIMFNAIKLTAYVLVIIGALNWGLVGLFDFNLVTFFFDEYGWVTKTIYIVIGISAIVSAIMCAISCKNQNMN